jgi:hypothetical protein
MEKTKIFIAKLALVLGWLGMLIFFLLGGIKAQEYTNVIEPEFYDPWESYELIDDVSVDVKMGNHELHCKNNATTIIFSFGLEKAVKTFAHEIPPHKSTSLIIAGDQYDIIYSDTWYIFTGPGLDGMFEEHYQRIGDVRKAVIECILGRAGVL